MGTPGPVKRRRLDGVTRRDSSAAFQGDGFQARSPARPQKRQDRCFILLHAGTIPRLQPPFAPVPPQESYDAEHARTTDNPAQSEADLQFVWLSPNAIHEPDRDSSEWGPWANEHCLLGEPQEGEIDAVDLWAWQHSLADEGLDPSEWGRWADRLTYSTIEGGQP